MKNRKQIGKFDITTGMIVTFAYQGYDKRPLVFVIDTDEYAPVGKKTFIGVNLNYLPIGELNKFFLMMLKRVSWEQDKTTGMPKIDLWDNENPGVRPNIIYDNIVKPKLLQKRDCWRTYKYNKITAVEQVAFKFADKAFCNSGKRRRI